MDPTEMLKYFVERFMKKLLEVNGDTAVYISAKIALEETLEHDALLRRCE